MKKFNKRLSLGIGIGFAILTSLGLMVGIFRSASSAASDHFFLPREATKDVIIVAIDNASLQRLGQWPWKRSVYADLIGKLHEDGAKTIALDVNFAQPSTVGEDEALGTAIKQAGNVVLPVELSFISQKTQGQSFDESKVIASIPVIRNNAEVSGFSNTPLDADRVVRRVPIVADGSAGARIYGFAYAVARLNGVAPSIQDIPLDAHGRMIIHFPDTPGRAFQIISAADVLEGKISADVIKNKTIFIGSTARDLHDEQSVATSGSNPMSGVEMHASIYDTLVQRAFLQEVAIPWYLFFFLLIGTILSLLVPRIRARTSLLMTGGIYIGWLILAFILFDHGWILDIVWIGILLVCTYLGLLLERWMTTERERRKTRDAFSRYVSPNVVESIMENIEDLKLGGARRNMSVLFSDLRGFTTLSEGLRPEELVRILNTYLHEMTSIVFNEAGVLDKYIGDAVMAFWNAPLDQPDHARRAVQTAIKMRETLKRMNEKKAFGGDIALHVGIGINTGDMVVGNIGGEQRYDFTVIGDSVNTASRTEGLCKPYGVEIIITEHTKAELAPGFIFRKLDCVTVKGKKEPMCIYEVLGFAGNVSDREKQFALGYEAALEAYFERQFKKAHTLVRNLETQKPNDLATKQLRERIEAFIKTPPPDNWNGVWVLTSK